MLPWFYARAPLSALGLALVSLLSVGCAPRAQFTPGEECDLNSDCPTSLVCRLGRCRVDCRVNRDCGAGISCLRGMDGLRGCSLPNEQECTLSSDCMNPALVCHFRTCTNQCDDDVDCPAGSRCVSDESGFGCRDESTDQCRLNTDCAAPFVCAVDGVCREECRGDRDCRDGKACLMTSPRVCGFPDAGVPLDGGPDSGLDSGLDGGPLDGGPDAGPIDGGSDAGPLDSGTDAGPDAGPAVGPPPPPLLAAGLAHTCAAPTAGDLRCWGQNDVGQLGAGSTTAVSGTSAVTALTSVTRVAAGANHACAIEGGTVYCWGDNTDGQVGVAGVHTSPTAVTLPGTANELACGNAHTCALADGDVYCWGSNADGQLGQPMATASSASPMIVSGLSGTPAEVATFSNHTCVRMDDGTVDCFGNNNFSQVGTAAPSRVYAPSAVAGLSGVVQIQTGTTHTCALTGAGDVLCWGLNTNGQLGHGGATTPTPTPTLTAGPVAPVLELGLGSTHSCARTASEVYCWGSNLFDQVGVAMPSSIPTPMAQGDLGTVASVRAGTNHTCVWVAGNDLRCFGRNNDNQLTGMSGPAESATPLMVTW